MTLTAAQRERLRRALEERARQLRAELAGALHGASAGERALPNPHADVDDDALADLEADLQVASTGRDAAELDAIDAALARIDRAEFGDCSGCGRPIGWRRLLAQPHAVRCIACASAAERATPPRL